MDKPKRGRPNKDVQLVNQFGLMKSDVDDIAFIQPRVQTVSGLETIRRCIKRTRQCIELNESTGLYTKIGNEFVSVRFLL